MMAVATENATMKYILFYQSLFLLLPTKVSNKFLNHLVTSLLLLLLLLCPRLKSLWANFLPLPLLLHCSCCSSRRCCSCCFCRIHHSTQQFCQKIKKPSSRKTVSKTWTLSTFFLCMISHQVHRERHTDKSIWVDAGKKEERQTMPWLAHPGSQDDGNICNHLMFVSTVQPHTTPFTA